MYSVCENFFRTLSGDRPDRLVNQWEPFVPILPDPLLAFENGCVGPGKTVRDCFGTCIAWPEGDAFPMPHTEGELQVLSDVSEWREKVRIPDLTPFEDPALWRDPRARADEARREGRLALAVMSRGLFERLHFLMGFEDALCALITDPEDCRDLLSALLEFKMEYARILIDRLRPDIILSHDDWGEKTRLFMSPDLWRDLFKPCYAELYGYIKSRGVLVFHHADSYCADIAEDMADIGIDVWQGCLPENDIPALQKRLKGRMTLMGGVDIARIDVAGVTEEEIRDEARRVYETYGPGGFFIPSFTYGDPFSIYPGVYDSFSKALAELNRPRF